MEEAVVVPTWYCIRIVLQLDRFRVSNLNNTILILFIVVVVLLSVF